MVKHQFFFSWGWLPPISSKNFPSPHYSCFWKIWSSLWRGFRLYYHPVGLLSVVCEVFEKLVINKIVDHLEKLAFSDFQYGFRCYRIVRAFNRSGATQAIALDISKAFDRVWHAGLLYKLKCYGISDQVFGLIFSFLSNRWIWILLDGKSSQEYPVNAGVP